MNILFLLGQFPSIGGVETVTSILANQFVQQGHKVSIVSFEQKIDRPHPELHASINLFKLSYPVLSRKNFSTLRQIIVGNRIEIIVNQWCLPYQVTYLCKSAMIGTNSKLVAVHHNTPDANARIEHFRLRYQNASSCLKKGIFSILHWLCKCATGLSLRKVYKNSNAYVLLSDRFHPIFRQITKLRETPNLITIENPLTIKSYETPVQKNNEVLYVGRLEHNQKRVIRVLETWKELETRFPQWTLRLVGDGPERQSLENFVISNKLERVTFVGFQSPESYYATAKILLLTSEYEGFPLVLPEAMSCGVVPVVYASYAAAYDLIDSDKNGVLLSSNQGFSAAAMAAALSNLMNDDTLLNQMAHAAKTSAARFSITTIENKWAILFNSLRA